jgi:hypothetical protein
MMRAEMGFYTSLLLAALAVASTPPRPDAYRLIEKVIDKQELKQELQRQYAYRETVTTEFLRKDGTVDKVKSETFQVTPSPDGEYRRLLAKDGRPLSPKQEWKEEKEFQEYIDKQLKLSSEERQRNTKKKLAGRVSRFQTRLREALEVYEFTELPDERLKGQRLRRFHFSPRPGYKPHSKGTKVLKRLEGTIWIDPQESQIVKLHIIFREDMKFFFGLFGRVSKGSQAVAEQLQAEDGLWLLENVTASLEARFYFFKKYRRRITYAYSDYEKYTVETEEGDFRKMPVTDSSR